NPKFRRHVAVISTGFVSLIRSPWTTKGHLPNKLVFCSAGIRKVTSAEGSPVRSNRIVARSGTSSLRKGRAAARPSDGVTSTSICTVRKSVENLVILNCLNPGNELLTYSLVEETSTGPSLAPFSRSNENDPVNSIGSPLLSVSGG